MHVGPYMLYCHWPQTIGNHEFDNGVDGLVPFLENVRFPVVSANIDATKDPIMKGTFNKSVVLEVGGQRIGVIGYITTDTPELVPIGKFVD